MGWGLWVWTFLDWKLDQLSQYLTNDHLISLRDIIYLGTSVQPTKHKRSGLRLQPETL
jgi:hypothetical protein